MRLDIKHDLNTSTQESIILELQNLKKDVDTRLDKGAVKIADIKRETMYNRYIYIGLAVIGLIFELL